MSEKNPPTRVAILRALSKGEGVMSAAESLKVDPRVLRRLADENKIDLAPYRRHTGALKRRSRPGHPSPLGRWLKEHRLKLGLSTGELAARCGLDRMALYHVERGTVPGERHIPLLSKGLKVPAAKLHALCGEPVPRAKERASKAAGKAPASKPASKPAAKLNGKVSAAKAPNKKAAKKVTAKHSSAKKARAK